MGIYLAGAGTLGCVVWPGTGITPKVSFPILSTVRECGTIGSTISVPVPLLPVRMNMASLYPWLSYFHTA